MSAADLFGPGPFTEYRATLRFRSTLVGGIPSDRSVIRKWLTARLDLGDERLEEIFAETIAARDDDLSVDDKIAAIMKTGAVSKSGFKRNPDGELFIEGRQVKAGLKEAANVAYPGAKFPSQSKFNNGRTYTGGFKKTVAETVFVADERIPLGVTSPTRVEERVGHPNTQHGRKSFIKTVEIVEHAEISFTVLTKDDWLSTAEWGRILIARVIPFRAHNRNRHAFRRTG